MRVFAISPRAQDPQRYWEDMRRTMAWSAKHGFTGILLFTGNDTLVDPWLAAQAALASTQTLSPLVAVNPLFMHPFSAAKMVSSLTYLYGRRIYLNMVVGVAVNLLDALGDRLSHDDRYLRLREYIEIMRELMIRGRIASFRGRFYSVDNLQLRPTIPDGLAPEFMLAGQSDAARALCRDLGLIPMSMLGGGGPPTRAVHFGMVVRERRDEAWAAARRLFPDSEEGEAILAYTVRHTDSVWKQRLHEAARLSGASSADYWLTPFKTFRADCPYCVGGYAEAIDLVRGLLRHGVDTFIVDLAPEETEYAHCRAVFDRCHPPMELPV